MAVISIIDDDASVRVATYRLVRSLGYIAHTFASADEFLRSSQLNDTSCVIADVQMPGMSGIELQIFCKRKNTGCRSFSSQLSPRRASGRKHWKPEQPAS